MGISCQPHACMCVYVYAGIAHTHACIVQRSFMLSPCPTSCLQHKYKLSATCMCVCLYVGMCMLSAKIIYAVAMSDKLLKRYVQVVSHMRVCMFVCRYVHAQCKDMHSTKIIYAVAMSDYLLKGTCKLSATCMRVCLCIYRLKLCLTTWV